MSQRTASHFPRVIPTFANFLEISSGKRDFLGLAKRAQSWIHSSPRERPLSLSLASGNLELLEDSESVSLLFVNPISPSQRVLVIYCKKKVDLRLLLEQVRGGPLEKVYERKVKNSNIIELHFLRPQDAQDFYKYCVNTPFFLVNGSHLWVEWDKSCSKLVSRPMLIPPYVLNQVSLHGASRCLQITKCMFGKHSKRIGSHLFYPHPPRNYLYEHLDIEELKKQLAQYGLLIHVSPMVSVNVSFLVHYADIRSAILLKKDVEIAGTQANKSFATFTVSYFQDPCGQKCYAS